MQVGLLAPHMDKFEYSDKPFVLWFEKFLQFGKRFFCIGQDLGHKCLYIIVVSDPVLRRPENFLPLILIFIFSRANSDINDVRKDWVFFCLFVLTVVTKGLLSFADEINAPSHT